MATLIVFARRRLICVTRPPSSQTHPRRLSACHVLLHHPSARRRLVWVICLPSASPVRSSRTVSPVYLHIFTVASDACQSTDSRCLPIADPTSASARRRITGDACLAVACSPPSTFSLPLLFEVMKDLHLMCMGGLLLHVFYGHPSPVARLHVWYILSPLDFLLLPTTALLLCSLPSSICRNLL